MAGTIVRFDPLAELDSLSRELFDNRFFRALRGFAMPTTDVYTEDEKTVIVEAQLPNFEEKDITVNVDQGALVIHAEHHEKEEDKQKTYMLRESSSSFYRSVPLPDGADDEHITATFSGGILKVTVPLNGASAPRQIAISTTSQPGE
ncbi:Hsp20/alpha crystallin family protein [Microbacterium rhizosphaerae]|uniref:Hsp20/alpha crystallin family protein n=1 Tax=Microbacterium rhizosphaerae TaxID=1678237 RepID=A0ABZ0SHV5_9MICO|nr:Hsp20/alpha crystallin family protein [Microbacterium rhizosphaerae]WPR88285.1 Hsp20/alpha crystallin family protein [Microbacterium rhizosphaerae]